MKKELLLTALLCAASLTLNAQIMIFDGTRAQADSIGEMRLLVQYATCCVPDTLNPEKLTEETMMLEIGHQVSKFHSYTKFFCDSILRADFANKASQETINSHMKQYGTSKLSERIFKGYPAGKITTLDDVAGITRLRCEEDHECPQWQLSAESDTLLSYLCHKAECDFKGRHWTVWYAPEISVSDGPWKLCGLPGLILKAADSQGHYSFTATGLELCHTPRPILFDGKKYETVSRKDYRKVHERYAADPVGFITNSHPNVRITIKDESGNPARNPRNMPYNPIERD